MTAGISKISTFFHKYRSLLTLGLAALLAELAYAILNLSAMPVFVKYTLHDEQALGIIISTFLLTEAVSRPAFGALGDRIGRKPLMIAGPVVTALTAYLTIHFHSIWFLVLLRAIDGLGSGALWPSAFAMIGDVVEEENRSAAMSILNVTYMSGLALGFLMGGAANKMMGSYNASFYLVSILLLMAAAVMLFIPKKLGAKHPEPMHGEPLEIPTLEEATPFKLSTLVRSFHQVPDMIVLACVIFLGTGLLMPVVKLYALDHLGLDEVTFGIAVAPIAAAMGIFAVPLGRLGDKYGKCVAVSWGLFGTAIALWALALFRSIIIAGVAGIVVGLGFTVAFPAWMALVSSATDEDRRGEVLGAVGMAQGLAAIVGTTLGAVIYSSDMLSFPRLGVVNYNVPFWLAAILLSIGTVISFTWVCRKSGSTETCGQITNSQRRFVVLSSIIGCLVLIGWVAVRYVRPVAPDRVAWQWMQQVVRGRPDKAAKLTIGDFDGACTGLAASKEAAKKFHYWHSKKQARYTVGFWEKSGLSGARVPIDFKFPKKKSVREYVILRKMRSGEWKVCDYYQGK